MGLRRVNLRSFIAVFTAVGLAFASGLVPAQAAPAGLAQLISVPSSNFSGPNDVIIGGDHVWVSNSTSRTITKVDRATGVVIGSTAVFANTPNKLAWDGTQLWVSFELGGRFAKVNADLSFSTSAALCNLGGSHNDSVTAANGRVFISCWNSRLLAELDTVTLAITQSTTMPADRAFAIRANTSKIYVDIGSSVRIYTIGALSTTPIIVNTGMPINSLHRVALDDDYFWMVGHNTGQTAKLGRLRLSDNTVAIYTVSSVADAAFGPISSDGRFVYLPNSGEGRFVTFDIPAETWQSEISSTTPSGAAASPGEVWALLNGALIKYSTNVQFVTWALAGTNVVTSMTFSTPATLATSSGPGTISYLVRSSGTTGCSVNSSTGAMRFPFVGTCVIRATASASGAFASAFVDVAFQASLPTQTVTWTPTNTTFVSSVLANLTTPRATTTGTGNISYAVVSAGTTSACTVGITGNVRSVTPGSCIVRATADDAGGQSPAFVDVTFTFVSPQVLTWAPSNTTATMPTASLTPSALAASSGPGVVTYAVQSAGTTGCTVNSSTAVLSFTSEGTCVIRATAAATSTHASSFLDVSFVIQPAVVQAPQSNQVAAGSSRWSIRGLTPRVVLVGEQPIVTLSVTSPIESASVSIGGIEVAATANADGEVSFKLPKLPLGTYAIDYTFDSSKLRFDSAISIVDELAVRYSGVDLVSRLFVTPSAAASGFMAAEVKQSMTNRAKAIGPVFAVRCTAYVAANKNTESARKLAKARANAVCAETTKTVGAKSMRANVTASARKGLALRQVLVELVFKKQ